MTASPTGEIIILLLALVALSFFLQREIVKNNSTWRFRISDFFVKRPAEPNEKNLAAVLLGFVMLGLLLFLLFQRIMILWS